MPLVSGLGYVGVSAPDLGAWLEFGSGVLGMAGSLDDAANPRAARFRIDGRAWRLLVAEGNAALDFIGWEVSGPEELQALARALGAAGVEVIVASPEEAAARSVSGLLRFCDPAGTRLEAFYGQEDDFSFVSPADVSGFVTGALGMGHVVLSVARYAECFDFYQRLLGFRLRETLRLGPSRMAFLGCSARHHSLGLIDSGSTDPRSSPSALQHLMVEVRTLDDVGKAYDRCHDRGVKISMTLGRHTNDEMTSFYARAPSGFDVEYGWGGLLVGDSFPARVMSRADHWGHRFPDSRFGLNQIIQSSKGDRS